MNTQRPSPNRAIAFLLIAVALLCAYMPSAFGQIIQLGKTDEAGIPSNGLSANFKRGSRFTLAQPGVATYMCALVDGLGGVSGSQTMRLAIYKDANGAPSDKVAETGERVVLSTHQKNWSCASILDDYALLPAGNYWLVIHSGGTAGVIRDYGDGTDPNWYGNADTYADGTSSPFGAGSVGTGTLAIYAYVTPSSAFSVAGRSTVGTVPSNGMSANYKRGSRFTLPEQGRLTQFMVYLDGKGGVTGNQALRMVLYTDMNGVPGTKVAESDVRTFSSGFAGRWFTFLAPQIVVEPGNYWIVLHTGGTAGVLRNYGGGPNSFFANADTFSDGASQTFGSGNAGTGTLSAFVMYNEGPYVTKTAGRTDVTGPPSSGMTADFKRASQLTFIPEQDAVLTGLYAYLDGNGGALGSQQVRLSIYTSSKDTGLPVSLVVESEVVSIPAGKPPGWVFFPVEPVNVQYIYGNWIAIHTGGTAGVARNYGGGPVNSWYGNADSFADGASFGFGTGASGTGTISMYATYTTNQPVQ